MLIDNEENSFLRAPTIEMERSSFRRNFRTLTTFNTGQLIPVFLDQCITFGDTVSMQVASAIRLMTPLNPTMDNARIDYYAYHIPYRQIWKHTKEFYGENTIGAWKDTRNFTIPQLKICWPTLWGGSKNVSVECKYAVGGNTTVLGTATGAGLKDAIIKALNLDSDVADTVIPMCYWPKSLMDYMGIPDLTANIQLPVNTTVTSIYTTFTMISTINSAGGTDVSISHNGSVSIEDFLTGVNNLFTMMMSSSAFASYFIYKQVSALPFRAYQYVYDNAFRNQNYIEPIDIETYNGDALTNCGYESYKGGQIKLVNRTADYLSTCLPEPQKGDAVLTPIGTSAPVLTGQNKNNVFTNYDLQWVKKGGAPISNNANMLLYSTGNGSATGFGGNTTSGTDTAVPANLYVDLSQAVAATINAQRLAYATQKILERDARGGTRFPEIGKAHFGVDISSLEIQIPEYLGGESVPINIEQINQTSETQDTPLGETGANSLTNLQKQVFTKSFVEPAIIMVLAAVRTDRTYGQGIHRDWFKKQRLDFYYPSLAFLGEQPVYNREIYADGSAQDEEVWGFQERWQEMRTGFHQTTGAMRVTYAHSLDVWHYGDKYETLPVLSKQWLQEDKNRVDRTLAVQSVLEDQFFSDWLFQCTYTRTMPIRSIPGLIDHY